MRPVIFGKKCVMHLPIHRDRREHHARQASDQKHEKEAEDPQHWQLQLQPAVPHRCDPATELHSSGNDDHQRCRSEEAGTHLWNASGEHVMHPDTEAEKTSRDNRSHNRRVSKDVSSRKHRHQCRDDRRSRQKDNVNLRVSEEPEQMLVEQDIAAVCGIKELRVDGPIHQKHGADHHHRRHGKNHHE
jgi:hypothetical protein